MKYGSFEDRWKLIEFVWAQRRWRLDVEIPIEVGLYLFGQERHEFLKIIR